MKVSLRPHQDKAVTDTRDKLNQGFDNICCVLPTGAGKSLCIADFARECYLKGEACVVIAHRDVLLGQLSSALCMLQVPHSFICSENTVRDITNANYEKYGDHWHDPRSRIIVISVATFASRLKDGKIPQSLLDSVKKWLMDECFPEGTLVDGKAIETYKVGDFVTSFNEETLEFTKKRITKIYKNKKHSILVRIHTEQHHVVETTMGHPFFTKRGWVKAVELNENDEVLVKSTEDTLFKFVRVDSVEIFQSGNPDSNDPYYTEGFVYNFEVEDNHTYVANGFCVHNCHHLTVGSQWGLCIESMPNAKGVGFTATPIRGDRKGLGRHASGYFDVLSCTTSMIKLVKAGMLTRMKVYQPDILDLGDLKVTASGDYNADKAYLKVKNQLKHIHGNAIEYYKRFVYGQPVITFAFNIEHGKEIARLFNEAGIPTMFVSSKSKESVRRQAVEDLRSGKLWNLVNVDLFGEGFDAPAVAGIFMLRKTESYSLYKQQIGRCLRPSEGKEYGYVFDHVGNVALMMMKYGLPSPYHDPEWTLDNIGKVSKKNGDDTPLPRTYECPKCSYEGPLKDVFDEDGELLLKGFMQDDGSYICPDEDCRHVFGDDEDKAVAKRIQEQKKGNLVELTFEVEQEFIRRRDEEVFKPASELDKGEYAAANMHRHVNRQNAITVLQHKINKWCNGLYKETGWPSDMIRKEFFITFGINIFEAQVLSAPKAEELARKVQQDDFRRSKTLSAQG